MPFLLFFLYRDKDKATSILSIGIAAEHERDGLPALRDRRHHSGNSVGSVSRCRSAGSGGWHQVATVGVAGAPLLGIVTLLFAMVSAFGAFLVRLQIAIYLAATHS